MAKLENIGEHEIWFVDDDGAEGPQLPGPEEVGQFAAYFNRIRKAKVRKQLILLIEEILAEQERSTVNDAPPGIAKAG
jgi:hypothetical protein